MKATVNGIVTNFDLRPGDYVTAGHAVNALVDTDSLRVDGYFEETKLAQIHPGDPARVRLLGGEPELHGHVESIAGGITDRERSASDVLLANITRPSTGCAWRNACRSASTGERARQRPPAARPHRNRHDRHEVTQENP